MDKSGAGGPFLEGEADRFFSSAPDALCIICADGLAKRLNPACEKMLGTEAAILVGKPFVDFVHPDDRDVVAAQLEKMQREGLAVAFEACHVCADGSSKWIAWRATQDPVSGLIYAVGREVALDSRADRQQEVKFRAIFESSAMGIAVGDRAGRPVESNRAFQEMLGYSAEELRHLTFADFSHPDDTAVERGYFNELLEGKRTHYQMEKRYYRKDGRMFWANLSVSLLRDSCGEGQFAIGLLEDITERKQAELLLKQRERVVTTLLDSLPGYAFFKDANGVYVIANQKFCDAVGYSKLEIAGKTAIELFPKDLADRYAEQDRWVFESGEPSPFDPEQEIIDGGRRVPLDYRKIPLKDENGQVIGLIGLGFDITERKRMEGQLRRAQRLETAGRVAGQVAHDLNNLLAPLAGYPELIKSQLPEGHVAEHFCDAMLEAAKEMADINKKVMTLGRKAHFSLEIMDLNKVVEEAVAQMPNPPKSLIVTLDLAQDLRPIRGSSPQLMQVISNLLSNAREAMGDAGLLNVKTEKVLVEGRLNKSEDGPYVRVCVSDTGCGIPPDIKDNLFEAFFMARQGGNRRGSGLGLLIIESVIHDHRGFVAVDSELGKGTTFEVYLPAAQEPGEHRRVERYQGGSESVLIVDDDEVQREVLRRLLQTVGYEVRSASSGEEAVAYLKNHEVDLLLLDMIMPPGIDGSETYRQALEVRPGLRAIIVSGFAESGRVREAQELGAGAFLHKPVTLEELARAVRAELERKRGRG